MFYYLKKLFLNYQSQGLIFLALAVIISLSLLTYTHNDPSFNLVIHKLPSNLLGYWGAFFSDLLYQFFGLAAFVFPVCCFTWSYLLFKYQQLTYLPVKLTIMLLTSIILSTFLVQTISLPNLPASSSGAIGIIIYPLIARFGIFAKISLLLLATISLIMALGINLAVYVSIAKSLKHVLLALHQQIIKLVRPVKKLLPVTRPLRQTPSLIKVASTVHPVQLVNQKSISAQKSFDPAASCLPMIDLLSLATNYQHIKHQTIPELKQNSERLLKVLDDFGVQGQIIDVAQGPVVTLYEFEPAAGTKSSRVIGLSDDIARSLSAVSTRIAAISGRNVLGIELPNKHRAFFCLRELIETPEYQDQNIILPLILGKDLSGRPFIADLAKMPHLLVAGTTGSGKSVAINTMIMSLLYRYTPQECRLIMIDPKMLELSVYDNIPHLLTPVVTESPKAVVALKWAVKEMENRYRLMSNIGVRNIAGYNAKITQVAALGQTLERTVQTGFDPYTGEPVCESIAISMEKLPFIVIIVDEMADLMIVAGKDIESSIQRLAQMARAAGIHIIMATQRPSVDVITGVIKANFPSRVSFKVTSKIDSRTILGEQGAEQLLGMGDMLYMGNTSKITRVHGPFVDDIEVAKVTDYLRNTGVPEYLSAVTEQIEDDNLATENVGNLADDDNIYHKAIQIIKTDRKVSISYIQRCLRIGYNRAALIIERMEKDRIISPPGHTGRREILLPEN